MACVYIQIGNITVWLPRHEVLLWREKKREGGTGTQDIIVLFKMAVHTYM